MSPKSAGTATSGAHSTGPLAVGQRLPQSPERSGLPSAVLGGGAARSGLPSLVRGTPAVGYSSHCANVDVAHTSAVVILSNPVFMSSCFPAMGVRENAISRWPREQAFSHECSATKHLSLMDCLTSSDFSRYRARRS